MQDTQTEVADILTHGPGDIAARLPRLAAYCLRQGRMPLSRHPAWLVVLQRGLAHAPYCLEAVRGGETCGILPLAFVRSLLFGRYLTSLPYLNSGGVLADHDAVEASLIGRAATLADRLDVRHLELRHERPIEHPRLVHRSNAKVHMRLELPSNSEHLWDRLKDKVRNQVRKATRAGLTVSWGGHELLAEFYSVFSRNMRDLGTPVYGLGLFRSVFQQFPDRAELCVVRAGERAVAAALVLHGWGISEVPSASCLRQYNHTNANMLMYWSLLERTVGRGQDAFDFGRSTIDSNTYRFKKQWGATAWPAEWQYYVRHGAISDVRPDNPRYRRMIRVWQRLPVGLTQLIGPPVVRGIP